MKRTWRWEMALAILGLLGVAGCGRARPALHAAAPLDPSITQVHRFSGPRAGTFISAFPACGCGARTVLARFSLRDGRRLGTLATLSTDPQAQLSQPDALADGSIWVSWSTGPRYRNDTAGGDPAPDTCAGAIQRLDPSRASVTTVTTIPRSVLITAAVPSPDGHRLAMSDGGCATAFVNEHIVIDDLTDHRTWNIGADAPPCHDLGAVAWSAHGTQLVFPYGPSPLKANSHFVPHGNCATPRADRLAVVSAERPTPVQRWRLISADPGCSFTAATFDHQGIAAVEGCATGAPRGFSDPTSLGDASLVQLDSADRVTQRLALDPGFNEGTIAADARTGLVLISEYQGANGRDDTVWSFDGRRLRTIHRYRTVDAPEVFAEPW